MNGALVVTSAEVSGGRVAALTLGALSCFALNSLLCRAALGAGLIDPSTFTSVRLAAGAAVLGLLARRSDATVAGIAAPPSLYDRSLSALALFLYALPFSLAYLRIEAGTGAFVVFGSVQVTMIGSHLASGRRMAWREALGLATALAGLGWLTRPGATAPDGWGVLMMGIAGASWGLYSIRGRAAGSPLHATARNFAAATPLALVASAITLPAAHASPRGLGLALAAGALTSGLGYVTWYAALSSLSPTRASVVQLAVPPLASALGVVILGEALTLRLLIAAPLILGGIAIAVSGSPGRR